LPEVILDTRCAVNEHVEGVSPVKSLGLVLAVLLLSASLQPASTSTLAFQPNTPTFIAWPAGLPVYDHVVIVVEENKGYKQIIGNSAAPYINGVLLSVA
jgi:hypothetical protein